MQDCNQMSFNWVGFWASCKKGRSEAAVKPNEKIASPTERWRTRSTSATTPAHTLPQHLSAIDNSTSTDSVLQAALPTFSPKKCFSVSCSSVKAFPGFHSCND